LRAATILRAPLGVSPQSQQPNANNRRLKADGSPETARKLLVSGTAKTPENFPRFFSGPVQERCDVER
jgi:hypothetical protein